MEPQLYFRDHGNQDRISEITGPGLHSRDHGNWHLKLTKGDKIIKTYNYLL